MKSLSKLKICITGSTSGIGYSIIKNLAKRPNTAYNLYVTKRERAEEQEGAEKLKKIISETESTFTPLELYIDTKQQVDTFIDNLIAQDVQFDVFQNCIGINNFALARRSQEAFFNEWNVNYAHTRYLTEQMLENDLINESGKIITITSEQGKFLQFQDIYPEVYAQIEDFEFSESADWQKIADLENLCIKEYLSGDRKIMKKWPQWPYNATKMFLNLFTIALSKDPRVTEKDIQVYAMCPGWCNTPHTARFPLKSPRSSDDGAQTALYLIDLPFGIDPHLQGGFFEREKKSSYNSSPFEYTPVK